VGPEIKCISQAHHLRHSAAAGHQRAALPWCISLPAGRLTRERAPASPEIERALKAKYHLDEPVWKQYFRYLGDLAHGDFGVSLKYRNHTVNDIIAQDCRSPCCSAPWRSGLRWGVGLPVGFFTAARRGPMAGLCRQFSGHAGRLRARICRRAVVDPVFLHQMETAARRPVGNAVAHDFAAVALGLFFAGKVARLFREGMLNAMQSDFITAARAKGLGENMLLLKHACRIAVLPVVSYSGRCWPTC